MAGISLGHLVHTNRPLTWRSPICCPRCTLEYTSSNSGDQVHREPLLLDCQHLLCSQCVNSSSVTCQVCGQRTSRTGSVEDARQTLHPSLFVLGMMQQAKYELVNSDKYWDEEDSGSSKNCESKSFTTAKLPQVDLENPSNLLSLLEKVYYAHDKAKDHIAQQVKEQQQNVCTVVEQINAHYVQLHNALQLEENEVLQKVRQAYRDQCRRTDDYQKQLKRVKEQLQYFIKQAKHFESEIAKPSSSYNDSRSLAAEVQEFLRCQPVKLQGDGKKFKHRSLLQFHVREKPPYSFRFYHKLLIEVPPWRLVPFAHEEGLKYDAVGEKEKHSHKSSSREQRRDEKSRERKRSGGSSAHSRESSREGTHQATANTKPLPTKHRGNLTPPEPSKLPGVLDEKPASKSSIAKLSEAGTSSRSKIERGASSDRAKDRSLSCATPTPSVGNDSVASFSPERSRASGRKHSSASSSRFHAKAEKVLTWSTVKVSFVVSPHEFYVQNELFASEGLKTICELCTGEAEEYEAALISGSAPFTIEPGSLYVVRPQGNGSLDRHWYRAEVLSDGTDAERDQYKVQYVDFGTCETVGRDQIRPMSAELAERKRGAFSCRLYHIKPTRDTWTDETCQTMMDFIGNRSMLMCQLFPSDTGTQLVVDLFLTPQLTSDPPATGGDMQGSERHWSGYYAPMSLRAALIYLGQASSHSVKNRHPCVWQMQKWLMKATDRVLLQNSLPTAPLLPEESHLSCCVTAAITPGNFYLMPLEWKRNAYEPLQRRLAAVCLQEGEAGTVSPVYCPYEGLVCAFLSTGQDENSGPVWLRGRVEKCHQGWCELFALDTGELLSAAWTDMRLLPPNDPALRQHPLAISCRLGSVWPRGLDSHRWSREAIDEFRQAACSKTLHFAATIESYESESNVYDVLLYLLNRSDRDTCVNGMLVKHGHALCLGPAQNIQDRMHQGGMGRRSGEMINSAETIDGDSPPSSPAPEVTRVADPRLPVELLRVVSPGEIYVALCSRKDDLEQLHQAIQEQMDDCIDVEEAEEAEEQQQQQGEPGPRSVGDVCVVFARATTSTAEGGPPSEWHRARIEAILDGGVHYAAFLIDRAITVRVHRTNVARLTARMALIQPGAILCRLACISPVGGSPGWHQSSVDAFRTALAGFSQHAISLDARPDPADPVHALSVVLWGMRTENRDALAPARTVYCNLNQRLVNEGLAHLSGRFRTFAKRGAGAAEEHQLLEDALAAQVRAAYEQLEQFFRTVAAVQSGSAAPHAIPTSSTATTEEEGGGGGEGGEGAVRDGSKTAQNVLAQAEDDGDDEWLDESCREAIALINEASGQPVDAWPPAVPLTKTIFVCTPTYVGSSGIVYLLDVKQEPVVARIRAAIQQHLQQQQSEEEHGKQQQQQPPPPCFRTGSPCFARYHLDGQFYRATVTHVLADGRLRVLFVDYGNVEECAPEELRPATFCGRLPVQAAQVRLAGIAPKRDVGKKKQQQQQQKVHRKWPEAALDNCHGLIVQKRCSIRIEPHEGPGTPSVPYCTLRLLDQGIDVGDALVELGMFERVRGGPFINTCSVIRPLEATSERDQIIGVGLAPAEADKQLPVQQKRSCEPISAEQRDLMRWMEEIQTQYLAAYAADEDEHEDPNEWVCDSSQSPLNRAQMLEDACPPVDRSGEEPLAATTTTTSTLEEAAGPRQVTLTFEDASPMPSPATLLSEEFDTSSRLSYDEDGAGDGAPFHPPAENEDGTTTCSSPLFRSFPVLPSFDPVRTRGFFAEYTNYGQALTVHVFPHLEGHTLRMASMADRVQRYARSTNELHRWQATLLEPGAPCLAPYREDGLYYRALLETRDEERREATVLFVDYLNRETVPLEALRKCPYELQRCPLRNVPVRLADVRANPRLRELDVARRLVGLLAKAFYVKLVPARPGDADADANSVPLVQLYTDADCQTLVYAEMLEEKYFLRERPSEEL